jgi:DNA-binding CsgD family transcriptional regulator/PAS domain-containing protein
MANFEQLSELIGAIYDCSIDPGRWHDTMRTIRETLDCFHCGVFMLDTGGGQQSKVRISHPPTPTTWRDAPEVVRDLEALYRNDPTTIARSLEHPIVMSRSLDTTQYAKATAFKAWAESLGLVDAIQTVVVNERGKLGIFSANRHKSVGVAGDREIEIMRLLGPHLRRAITISDLLDMRALQAQALGSTLDSLSIGVVIVAAEARILQANVAASLMFGEASPIRSSGGKLSAAATTEATTELHRAIELARSDETAIGNMGIGVALPMEDGEKAIAHVLPLARGDIRTRLVAQGTAAVFVTRENAAPPASYAAIASTFGLTPAEARILERVSQGQTLAEAAKALNIAETTAKTHLGHLFGKMGVSRQADLVALVARLIPPLQSRN